jgi:hydrogenase maturation protease
MKTEPLHPGVAAGASSGQVLIAGIGNIFLGDDGFGVEVVRALQREPMPPWVSVEDFGIRGLHLALRLLEPVSQLLVVDAASRGATPGTLYLIEPEVSGAVGPADGHSISLPGVFSTLVAAGGEVPPVLLLGCEPESLGEGIGLSPPVGLAVPVAVRKIMGWVEGLGRERGRDVAIA